MGAYRVLRRQQKNRKGDGKGLRSRDFQPQPLLSNTYCRVLGVLLPSTTQISSSLFAFSSCSDPWKSPLAPSGDLLEIIYCNYLFGFPPTGKIHYTIPCPSRAPLATRPKIVLSNQLRAEYRMEYQSTGSAVHCSPMNRFAIPALWLSLILRLSGRTSGLHKSAPLHKTWEFDTPTCNSAKMRRIDPPGGGC